MKLDMFTALVECGVAMLLLGGLFLFLWLRDRRASWLLWWSAPFFFACLSTVVFARWTAQPGLVVTMVGNDAVFICLGLVWQATRVFERRPPLLWPIAVAVVVWSALCFLPLFAESLPFRVAVGSIFAAPFCWLAAHELWRGREEGLASRPVAVGVLIIAGALFAVRLPLLFLAPFPFGALPLNPEALAVFALSMFAIAVVLTVAMIAMSKERGEQEQRQFAHSDPLTGLLNRRAYLVQSQRMMRKARATNQPVCLLVLDLDHFKSINDRYGHDTGDRVLVKFAAVLEANLRPADKAFRMGGEEFCCLLPGATLAAGRAVSQRICSEFAAGFIETMGVKIRATVSVGIASTERAGHNVDELQSAADAAVYDAKARGRNMAVAWGDEMNAVVAMQQHLKRQLRR